MLILIGVWQIYEKPSHTRLQGDAMTNLDEIRQHMELLTDDELIEILQEHDEDQWRPEVFDIIASILSSRGGSSARPPEGEEEIITEEPEAEDLSIVAEYLDPVDAKADRKTLEDAGIRTWLIRKHDAGSAREEGIKLEVRDEDMAAAMRTLEREFEPVPSSDLPPEIAEPPCPKCGSRKVTEEAEVVESLSASGGHSRSQVWFYHCAACGHKWPES
jgi:DNA-directed RNA polymerase subunit M/transcription elongation factor TFIIS